MGNFKKIDLFGRPIKSRIFQEDLFTSNFGAFVTLLLPIIICTKLFLFYKKSIQYGFARTRIMNKFQEGNYSMYNFTEFEMMKRFKFDVNQNSEKISSKYEDYFNFVFYYEDFSKQLTIRKTLTKIKCTHANNLPLQNYYCFRFEDNLKILNISNLLFFSESLNGNYVDQLQLFKILIRWKKKLEDLYKNLTSVTKIYFYYNYFKFDFKNFNFYKITKEIEIYIDQNFETNTIININKISMV